MSDVKFTDEFIRSIGPDLKRLASADIRIRSKIQEFGVDVVPLGIYCSHPSISEIKNSFEYTSDGPPYLLPRIFEPEKLNRTLSQLLEFADEFNPPTSGDENAPSSFFWNNNIFSYSDAMSYYCFIREIKPTSIVEIGSGFSTLVAIEAVERNRAGTIHCIEPFPRKFLTKERRINLHTIKAQNVDAGYLNRLLRDNDILFIDSTHTVKTGSDCLHIYLRLIPEIRSKVFVHVHDVFLPFGMPKEWLLEHQYFWTEQYLLLAFLLDNPKASVLYGSNYNARWNTSLMEALMKNKYGYGGGSLWFQYDGNPTTK